MPQFLIEGKGGMLVLSRTVSKGVTAALLMTLFMAPSLRAVGRQGHKPVKSQVRVQEGVFRGLWRNLTHLFEKEGASIDPNGAGTGGTGTNDGGASIDPSGVPGPQPPG